MISLAPPPTGSASRQNRTKSSKSIDRSGDDQENSGRLGQIVQAIDQNIWLPDSPITFAFYVITLGVLCGGLFLHINLSATITETEYDINAHTRSYYEIERESAEIISQIAIATSMFDIYSRATALGYVPVTDSTKNFVAASDIQVPQPQLAAIPNVAPNNNADDVAANIATDVASGSSAIASITVAEALEANGNGLTGSNVQDTGNILSLGLNNAGLNNTGLSNTGLSNADVLVPGTLGETIQAGGSEGLTRRLLNWLRKD